MAMVEASAAGPLTRELVDFNKAGNYSRFTPKRFKRVKATGSRKPGYIRGTGSVQRRMVKRLRELQRAGWRLVSSELSRIGPSTLAEALDAVRGAFTIWEKEFVEQATPIALTLYDTGMKTSLAEIGFAFGADIPDINALAALTKEPHGIVPALQHFVEEDRAKVETIIRASFEGGPVAFDLDDTVKAIQQQVGKEKWRVERIVRTETSKIAGFGRLHAWEADPQRDMYHYHWIATLDGRHKDVSAKLMREGPYTFDKIKELWLNPVAKVIDRKTGRMVEQDDKFNQRCTLARTLKSKEVLVQEGLASKEEAESLF